MSAPGKIHRSDRWLILHAIAFVLATALTQVGGFAYLGTLLLSRWGPFARGFGFIQRTILFLTIYGCLWTAASFTAPHFGRVPLPCDASDVTEIVVQSPLYCVLNRHYVTPELLEVANELAAFMDNKFPGTQVLALDANFPFLDGFPMLPHLSHADGLKLDVAFLYENEDGQPPFGATRSPIGYWAFEPPQSGAKQPCAGRFDILTLRWNMVWFRFLLNDLQLDETRTSELLRWLSTRGVERGVSKIFIEPHLAQRFGVQGGAIRFQGCRAARHDDHIHLQIR